MDGAFGPFIPLGQALVAAGHEVLVATGPNLQEHVAAAGFQTALAGPSAIDGSIAALNDPAVQSAGPEERWRFPATMFGSVIAPAKLPELRDLANTFEPDLVIHPQVDLAGPLLAAERGLPSVCYGFLRPLEQPVVSGLAAAVAPLWEQSGLTPDPYAGLFRGPYLDPCPPALRGDLGPAAAVARPIRSEIPGDGDAHLPSWAQTLGARPVLYVSLGTVPFFNQPARFQALLGDLMQEDVELILTVSELHEPAALGELPAHVHIEQWLSLAALLPRCDAVLCHAGSGTTLAAMAAGLPLVLVPDGADQFTNAQACRAAGVARVLMPDEVSAASVRAAAASILRPDSPEAERARQIAEEIAAMPAASDVTTELEELVAERTGPEAFSEPKG
jgi:UDP:flavonoid glycosyltransferase YjiC (YdhE family)